VLGVVLMGVVLRGVAILLEVLGGCYVYWVLRFRGVLISGVLVPGVVLRGVMLIGRCVCWEPWEPSVWVVGCGLRSGVSRVFCGRVCAVGE
jgi:hypothetical protein